MAQGPSSTCCCTGGGNFLIPLPGAPGAKAGDAAAAFEDDLSRTIVDCEVNSGAWTLMHRYNKAADLLSETLSVRHTCTRLTCCSASLA